MMSKKEFAVLVVFYVLYMLVGAAIFYHIESREEVVRRETEREERREIEELLNKHYVPSLNESQDDIFNKLTVYCGKPMTINMTDLEEPPQWDYYHSVYFVITVVSTIGYGNLAPTTMLSRIFMIFYSLIGIPINGIVMMVMGHYFGKCFTKLYERWKKSRPKYDPIGVGLVSQIILYLVPGFTFFIFIPAVIFMLYEGWTYEVSVYYAYVTLSTIGFGDYVTGTAANGFDSEVYWIYKVFLLFWLIIGLGYLAMILDYITAGMQSKKIVELEQFVADNLRKTPIKVREELRTILNEFLVSRVKLVYKASSNENSTNIGKSNSCPNLMMYREKESPATTRRRALSTCPCNEDMPALTRVQSDTNLTRIDKDKTFSPSETDESGLLMRVANALGKFNHHSDGNEDEEEDEEEARRNEGGVHCFSDSQILASENGWTIDGETLTSSPFSKERKRAASEIKFPFHENADVNNFTWYGPAATKKLQEMRERIRYGRTRSRTLPAQSVPAQPQSFFTRIKNTLRGSNNKNDKSKDIDVEGQDYVTYTPNNRESIPQTRRRPSIFPVPADDTILEETSIAEFIRALTAIQVPESTLTEAVNTNPPRRKLGTAGITPPRYQSPPRTRRMPIRSNLRERRCSLAPTLVHHEVNPRRFSLRPVDVEGNLLPPPREEAETHVISRQVIGRGGVLQPPPPYTPHEGAVYLRMPVTRRYSINPACAPGTSSPSPIQRQVKSKKDKDEKDK